tara:strand:+ start:435 stop:1190 length:756 start_codon:yes stop_codon:yes gene_type:complete
LKSKVYHNNKKYTLNVQDGIDLSIPINFSTNGPSFFNANYPNVSPIQSGDFIGDIKQGGSCNAFTATIDIHCTGTHTESIGHIDNSGTSIIDVCPLGLISAYLISVFSQPASRTDELYHCNLLAESVITKKSIQEKLTSEVDALIIRTFPNNKSKKYRNYDSDPAPFFTNDAIDYLQSINIKHLLVDLPSIDKLDDGGQLGNHKRFFKKGKTISELLYIPNDLEDGFGFLQIQIPPWRLDAAPSRPIFYPI